MNLKLKTFQPKLFLQVIALVILLYGCGKDDPEPTNGVPVAQADSNQEAEIGSIVKLDASGSKDPDGDALTFNWSFISKPENSISAIIGVGKEQAEFMLDKVGIYEVQLKVSDGKAEAISSLTITNKTPIIAEINTNTSPSMDNNLAQRGRNIYIYGNYFSPELSDNKVTIGDLNYVIEDVDVGTNSDGIRVIVPEEAISGELKVSVGDKSVVFPTPIRIMDIPVNAFVEENTHLEEKIRSISGNYFEIGARFKPLVNGKVVALTLRMPSSGSYDVTLWDGDSKAPLITKTIVTSGSSVKYDYLTTEIALEKNKIYMITVNADNWYNHIDEQDSQGNQYPQTIDNFEYISLGFHDGSTKAYPDEFPINYITKGADIIFAADVP